MEQNGHARVLLSELISSISTRTKQDGNALPNILEKFISKAERRQKIAIVKLQRLSMSS